MGVGQESVVVPYNASHKLRLVPKSDYRPRALLDNFNFSEL